VTWWGREQAFELDCLGTKPGFTIYLLEEICKDFQVENFILVHILRETFVRIDHVLSIKQCY
jgi:hypothetical protein